MVEMWPGGAAAEDGAAEDRVRLELARELHDRVSPLLTAMLVEMEHFKLEQGERHPVVARVSRFQEDTREVLNNLREVLSGLRGGRDLTIEFVEAIRQDLIARFVAETGIPVRFRVSRSWPARLPTVAAINLYRIVGEALANAHRHSGTQRASVTFSVRDELAVVTVRDEGGGVIPLGRDATPGSYGILGMRERALLLGGHLSVSAARPRGTVVRLEVPLSRLA